MYTRLQKDYRKMKRVSATILAASLVLALFSGCSRKISESDTSETTELTSVTATETTPASETSAEITRDPNMPETFEALYGDQLINYLNHQYYFDGEEIPKVISNYYFLNTFSDMSNNANMGYYPLTAINTVDLAAEYPGEEYDTYGDYFLKRAEYTLMQVFVMLKKGEAEGITLSDSDYQRINETIEYIRTDAAANMGMTVDEYYRYFLGPEYNETVYRQVLEKDLLATAYVTHYCEDYIRSNSNAPYVRYALFYAPDSADQDTKDAALAAAQAMKDSCGGDIEKLAVYAYEAQINGTVYDQGDISVPKGAMAAEFEKWAWDEKRTAGELDVIYSKSFGYFVVGCLGTQEGITDADLLEARNDSLYQIAVNDFGRLIDDEITSGKHELNTPDVFLPAPAAPTPTEAPAIPTSAETEAETAAESTVATAAATESSAEATPAPKKTGSSTTDVLVVVFIVLAAVAVAAVVVILISYTLKNGKNSGTASESDESGDAPEAEDGDEAEEDNGDEESSDDSVEEIAEDSGESQDNEDKE